MSFVLLWQPSNCIDLFQLFVIDYIFVSFSGNKYDDNDYELQATDLGLYGMLFFFFFLSNFNSVKLLMYTLSLAYVADSNRTAASAAALLQHT